MIRIPLRPAGLLALILPGFASSANGSECAQPGGDLVAHVRVYSPLIMAQVGASTDIRIDSRGCVVSRYPSTDVRHGVHAFKLTGEELASLAQDLRASGADRVDAAQLQRDLASRLAKSGAAQEMITTDADLLEIDLGPSAAVSKSGDSLALRWHALQQDMMNHPEVSELQAIDAVKRRVMSLTADERMTKESGR